MALKTCKDCICEPVCPKCFAYKDVLNVSDYCEHFKDKADVVEVVRCKDCKHFLNDTDYCKEHNKGYCEWDNTVKSRKHFCSYGHRKEGAEG